MVVYFDNAKKLEEVYKQLKGLGYSDTLIRWLDSRVEFRVSAQGATKAERLNSVAVSSKRHLKTALDRINYEGNVALIADTELFEDIHFNGIRVGVDNHRRGVVYFGTLEAACLLLATDGQPDLIMPYFETEIYSEKGIFVVVPTPLSVLTKSLREQYLAMGLSGMAA